MVTNTKKLISNLKEDIEIDKEFLPEDKCKKCKNSWKGRYLDREQAQLQFAKKLIKALKKDIQNIEISCVGMPEEFIKGADWAGGLWKSELKKLLDDAIKWATDTN